MTNRKSGKKITFCLIALDPDNRLRYPLVSLFFDIRWWFWLRRDAWANLFDIRFFDVKVGLQMSYVGVRLCVARKSCAQAAGTFLGFPGVPGNQFGFRLVWLGPDLVLYGL